MADGDRGGFWTSFFPGVLTGVAAVLTALGGLALALNQAGLFKHEARTPPPATTTMTTPTDAAPAEPAGEVASDNALQAVEIPAANLLTAGAGGEIVAASSDDWAKVSDGDEATDALLTGEVVYALGDGKGATFDTFGVFVPGTLSYNLAEYELSVSDTGATGPFSVIGRFKLQNIKLYKSPYQEVMFAPMTARFLRFRIVVPTNGADIYELRLRKS